MAKLTRRAPQVVLLAEGLMAAKERWERLEVEERAVLVRLLKQTKGRPGNLTAEEKRELRRLAKRLDLPGLGRELIPAARRSSRRVGRART